MKACRSGIDLSLHSYLDADVIVSIDENKFSQVMMNLIGNALKFTPAGGRVTVSVSLAENTKNVIISVTDTGVGIAKVNSLQYVFRSILY